MATIAEKISLVRKNKGMTQEELSEKAKINLRTLQRIESGETVPRTSTLKNLCYAMQVNFDEIIDTKMVENNNYLVWLHLTPVTAFIMPLGNIILPLILWLNKRDDIQDVREQGANIINFQIFWYSLTTILAGIVIFNRFFRVTYFLLPAFLIVNVIYPIIIGILVKKGRIRNYYPSIIRFIK